MIFKHEQMEGEFFKLHPKMQLVICEVNWWCYLRKVTPTWTCFYRSEEEQRQLFEMGLADSPRSVHCLYRGADMRVIEDHLTNKELIEYINFRYRYDPARPNLRTALTHGGTAVHNHFQVVEA